MHTFLFADLVGFTALSIEHGDEEAANVATRFQREVGWLAARHRATLVKSLGDGAMVRAEDAVVVYAAREPVPWRERLRAFKHRYLCPHPPARTETA